jgi:hypothetical protein
MIAIASLKPEHIGHWVRYRSCEIGRIKSWNDSFVFVVYHCQNQWDRFSDWTAAATLPEDLELICPPDK